MEVRPVLRASDQLLTAVEARDADTGAALTQLAAWDRQGLHVPRIVVGLPGAPDVERIEGDLAARGVAGARLALALPEAWLDAAGMREALERTRARTGAVAIVADFGSGTRPDVEFLVDYPADALALSARIAAGGAGEEGAARVREICDVARELGWRVIAPDVASAEERGALAAAGVDEVAGPGVAPFELAESLSPLLSRLRVSLPAAPEPSRRAPQAASPPRIATPPERRAHEGEPERQSPFSEERGGVRRDPAVASRLERPKRTSSGSPATPSGARGSPGRSRPQRSDPETSQRRGPRVLLILLALLLLAIAAYVVLAYLGHVPDPLGIEDFSL